MTLSAPVQPSAPSRIGDRATFLAPRRAIRIGLVIAGLLAAGSAAAQSGGGFDLSWASISGGGARSTGGTFAVNGLVSPPLAGHAAGGSFTLDGGWGAVTATIDAPPIPVALPTQFALLPPSPNPSAHEVAIGFDLPRESDVHLEVYDLRGRRVGVLAEGTLPAGHHALTWNAAGSDGVRLSSGIYFLRFDAAGFHTISRVVLIH